MTHLLQVRPGQAPKDPSRKTYALCWSTIFSSHLTSINHCQSTSICLICNLSQEFLQIGLGPHTHARTHACSLACEDRHCGLYV